MGWGISYTREFDQAAQKKQKLKFPKGKFQKKLKSEEKPKGDEKPQGEEKPEEVGAEEVEPLNVLVSVEHSGYSFRLGKKGQVLIKEHQDLCVKAWADELAWAKEHQDFCESGLHGLVQMKLSAALGGVVEIPPKLLVRADDLSEAQPLQSFKHKSRQFKQWVLMRAGMSDPETDTIELMSDKVIQPNEDHLSLCFAHLAWAIEGKDPREEDQIGFIPPQVSRTFLECLALDIKKDEHELCMERCKQLAQRMLKIKGLILVPVWAPGKGVNHFTLLALRYYQATPDKASGF